MIADAANFVQALVGREGNDGTGFMMFILVLIAPLVILSRIIRHESIGLETILGAICVYVLLGIGFAGIYAGDQRLRDRSASSRRSGPKTNVDFLYFSFVTRRRWATATLTAAPTPDACS